jgi:hypothetical protein
VARPPDQLAWLTVEFDTDAALDSVVLAIRMLRRVFGGGGEPERVKLFRSPNAAKAAS